MRALDFEDRILLYMDIIGTKDGSWDEWIEFVDKISSINQSHNFSEERFSADISSFSDHILMSYPIYENDKEKIKHQKFNCIWTLLNSATIISIEALTRGLLMRGAISTGKVVHKDNIVRGKEFDNMVNIEEKMAIYPRVVVTKDFLNLINSFPKGIISPTLLSRDFDGIFYVDYLKSLLPERFPNLGGDEFTYLPKVLEEIRIKIELNLNSQDVQKDMHKLAKWEWLANKFDESVDFWRMRSEKENWDIPKIEKFNLIKYIKIHYGENKINSWYILDQDSL